MIDDLRGKVIVVTGGASGLGDAICQLAAHAGARVAIVDRDGDAASAVADRLADARGYRADVTVADEIEAAVANVVRDFGRLDAAVNSAGISGTWGKVIDCTLENWDATIATNLTGTFLSLKAQLPHLVATGGGAIVNIASLSGVLPVGALPAYTASKHGVIGLTKSTALDYGPQGIRCNAVCPAFVRTPFSENLIDDPAVWETITERHPIGRLVTADEVANATLFLLSSASGGTTGSVHLVDGGILVT